MSTNPLNALLVLFLELLNKIADALERYRRSRAVQENKEASSHAKDHPGDVLNEHFTPRVRNDPKTDATGAGKTED